MSSRSRFWWVTVGALLAVALTFSLGRWQLSRASQKLATQAGIDAMAALPALRNEALLHGPDLAALLYRKARLRGHWMPGATICLDNRPLHDQAGLVVVTPLKLEGSAAVLLVQRGWVARDFHDRTKLPDLETADGNVEIEGRIAPLPGKIYDFGGSAQGRIRQNVDPAALGAELGVALLPVSVQQSGAGGESLVRDWPIALSGVDRNYGYAFQWFALSALIAFLYVWFQIVRRFIRARHA